MSDQGYRAKPALGGAAAGAWHSARGPNVVFVLSGHGCQWPGMAADLIDASPLFADRLGACDRALRPHLGWSVLDVLGQRPRARRLRRVDVVQPALFAVSVSLGELLGECGVAPVALVGHSQGEVAAAHLAGALSLTDAAAVIAKRARLLARLSAKGGMLAVALERERVDAELECSGGLELGAVNGPGSFALTGERMALQRLLADLRSREVRAAEVAIDYASHSRQIETLRGELVEALADISPGQGRVPLYSTLTGELIDANRCDPEHWYRIERQPVLFEPAVRALLGDGHRMFLELGAHPVLAASLQQTVDSVLGDGHDALVLGSLRRGQPGPARLMAMLGQLSQHQLPVDLPLAARLLGLRALEDGSRGASQTSTPGALAPAARQRGAVSQLQDILEQSPPSRRAPAVRQAVFEQVAAALGVEVLEPRAATRTFKDLGLESAGLVELRNRLRLLTGLPLSASLMFDCPTPESLADHLLAAALGGDGRAQPRKRSDRPSEIPLGAPAEEVVAIVGMSCRLPGGVTSPRELWELVAEGRDAVGPFPADRGWDLDGLYDEDPDRPGTIYAREGGFVYDVGCFDAAFFGTSPREALMMDPQQRLFLEGCWEAIERAGMDPRSLAGSPVGVFAGSNIRDYNAGQWLAPNGLEGYSLTGTAGSIMSGRVAYLLGLEGPALTIDTACSSSLVAIHLACASLRSGECSIALAGGATAITTPGLFAAFSRQRALAPDGRCKPFADAADGTGWGEGSGVVVLERLLDARAAGHPVLAVVRGSAVNQDGASNGLTAPSGLAQQRVIEQALADARLSAQEVDLVEAHGTGTKLGDPIEAGALIATYGQRSPDRPLWLGSVKSNIGHTQAAAGVAGVIKAVMAIRHEILPQTLHVDRPSSEVDWSQGAVELLSKAAPWRLEGGLRRAGVSSYGISGTNAHLILEQAPDPSSQQAEAPRPLRPPGRSSASRRQRERPAPLSWPLSGRDQQALRGQAQRLSHFLTGGAQSARAQDVGRSLARRPGFDRRAVVLAAQRDDLVAGLDALAGGLAEACEHGELVLGEVSVGATVFLFTGQGSQRAGMGHGLYEAFPAFRSAFDEICGELDGELGCSLRDVVFGTAEDAEALLSTTKFAQTGLFALEVSLYRLLQSWGVRPDFLIGHSIGELAAAHVAGVFSLSDGCRLVAARARLMDELPSGGQMLALEASADEASTWLEQARELDLAAVNGPRAVVLSGSGPALDAAAQEWATLGRRTKRLAVSHAFHSASMEPMLAPYRRVAAAIDLHEPRLAIVSNLTGRPVQAQMSDPEYWVRQVRETVRFADGASWLVEQGAVRFVELGPDGILSSMVEDCMAARPADGPAARTSAVALLKRRLAEPATLFEGLARAWVSGCEVDWETVHAELGGEWIELPTYAFQRERHWLELPRGFWVDEQGRLTASASSDGGEPAESPFWQAVENEDPETLGELLGLAGDQPASLESVRSALSSWHRRRQQDDAARDWSYELRWQPVAAESKPLVGSLAVLVPPALSDCDDIRRLKQSLEGRGASVSVLAVDPTALDRAGMAAQLDELARSSSTSELGRITEEAAGTAGEIRCDAISLLALDDAGEHDRSLSPGVAATLLLVQALGDRQVRGRLWIATRQCITVGGEEAVDRVDQRMTWGLGRALRLEDPQRWGGLLDLPRVLDEAALERLCDALGLAPDEDELAVRPSGIFAPRLTRRLQRTRAGASSWQASGTALITGGSGALAGHLARWLARQGAERIVLASRRGPEAPGASELQSAIRSQGAQVHLVACDVTDREQLGQLLDGMSEQPPSMVFHTAGVLDDELIDRLTLERLVGVLSAKVLGARHLHELTAPLQLSAFVLFSSISATLGSGGQAAYCAANAYLDALAEQRRGAGLVATSIAWGAWGGGGMAAGVADHMLRRGVREMQPEFALAALGRVLADAGRDAVIADIDWERYARSQTGTIPMLRELPELAGMRDRQGSASGDGQLSSRLAGLPEVERLRVALELVRTQAAAVLGHSSVEAVAPERAFRDMGFDSLSGVELRNRLIASSGLRLPTTVIFDYPTAAELAEHLLELSAGAAAQRQARPRRPSEEPTAIVGMACRFPGGADSPERLWELLAQGGDAISAFPSDRGWDVDSVYHPDPEHPGTTYAREGGFLHEAAEFDAAFFGIGPREALAMSPQQRLLLETCWEALEKAGIDPHALAGSDTGVFVGESLSDYGTGLFGSASQEVKGYLGTGTAGSIVSGRIAYFLGLEGPAVTLNTACSSSLVALHLAAAALRSRESSMALVGGVTVMATPSVFIDFSRQRGTAPDGRCKAFADDADGAGWGEGVGIVVLERLSDALASGREVLAVLKGSAVNQDGASNGLTAPSGRAQQRVIRQALESAGLSPREVDAVEAHGTGTRLGDPIEAQALLEAYGQDRSAGDDPLWLGSIKSNIGHTQAAAGIAGVIKMVMAMRHGLLPRTLHVGEPSRRIDWSSGGVALLTEEVPWQRNGRPRRAGVSSFGISGTNAHVIVEDAPAPRSLPAGEAVAARTTPFALVLSARSESALHGQAAALRERFAADPTVAIGDLAVSLAARAQLEYRAVLPAEQRDSVLADLRSLAKGEPSPETVTGLASAGRTTAFMFTGQGAQRAGMGAELYRTQPAFARALEEVCELLDERLGISLRELMFAPDGSSPAAALHDTTFTQAALFALEVAIFRLLESWGVRADYLIGHSVGEIAAAHVAGVFSLADACALVSARGRLMGELPTGGAMLALQGTEQELGEWVASGEVSIAAVNGPGSVVLSGPEGSVLALGEQWRERGRKTHRLRVSHAFHSALMDPMLESFARVAEEVEYGAASIPIVSNLTGEIAGEELCTAGYWVRHVRETVRFADGVSCLLDRGVGVLLELGPSGALCAMAQESLRESDEAHATGPRERARRRLRDGLQTPVLAAVMRSGRGEAQTLRAALGAVWVGGGRVDWSAVLAGAGNRVALPTYAFQRERFWLDSVERGGADPAAIGQSSSDHPLLGAASVLADERGWLFTGRLSLQEHPWLADHVVLGEPVLPGAALLELALHAGGQVGCPVVEELTLHQPLLLPRDGGLQLQVLVGEAQDDGARAISIHSRPEQDERQARAETNWVAHASGALVTAAVEAPEDVDLAWGSAWPPPDAQSICLDGLYDWLLERGLDYGPAFQGLKQAWRREGVLFAEAALAPEESQRRDSFAIHPALLDAVLHATALGEPATASSFDAGGHQPDGTPENARAPRLPFCWRSVQLRECGEAVRVRITAGQGDSVRLVLAGADGRPFGSVGSLVTRAASAAAFDGGLASDSRYRLCWRALEPTALRPQSAPPPRSALVGLVGTGASGGLRRALAIQESEPAAHRDVSALRRGLDDGDEAPGLALLDCTELAGSSAGLPADAHMSVMRVLDSLQQWLADERLSGSRLVICTRHAVSTAPGEPVSQLAGAAVWGLVRCAQSESPGRFSLVDLGADVAASWPMLARALAGEEPQLALRDGELRVARLERAVAGQALETPDGQTPWRLDRGGADTLEGLRLAACPDRLRPLGPREVRVQTRAAGVNFKDVLIALGVYPGAAEIGNEAAGVVLEVGSEVEHLAVGDRVCGLFAGAFGPLVLGDSRLVARMPATWSFAEGSCVPLAYLTAYYALVDLAELRAGERLLVHAGAGGVGTAAIQLAQHLGVEVLATASDAKRSVLEARGLSCERIASSRDPSFAERFLETTQGTGVHAVLNSLTGELVDASLRLLGDGGRFLEMGKTDIRDPEAIAREHPGVVYRAFDLMQAGLDRIQEMFVRLMELFEAGALELPPLRAWDVRHAPEALRHMSQARHVGKLALTMPPRAPADHGTTLITGGTGGLGGLLAAHLVRVHGVRHLLLASRAGAGAPGARELERELERAGARVRIASCDVGDRQQVASLVASVDAEHPLRAVIHAAGVLDDGLLESLTPDRVARALVPKLDGAWHLHELTAGHDLDAFVLFSSVAGTLGAPGQANYAAANSFLDGLAAHRRARGLPGLAIAWGPWQASTGMTAQLSAADLARMADAGMPALAPDRALALFDRTLDWDEPLAVLARVDTRALEIRAANRDSPAVLNALVRRVRRPERKAEQAPLSLAERLASAPAPERTRIVREFVRAQTAAVLGHASEEALDSSRTFKDLGFDSLAAVELRNRIGAATGTRLAATLVFDYPTLTELVAHLLEQLAGEPEGPSQTGRDLDELADELARLSAEQVRRSGIAVRLREILAGWSERTETHGSELDEQSDLAEAADEELFELIDREFGVS